MATVPVRLWPQQKDESAERRVGSLSRGSVPPVPCDSEHGCLSDGAGHGVRVPDDSPLTPLPWGGGAGCTSRSRVGFPSLRVGPIGWLDRQTTDE